jgi:tRNA threonylcarbamoyl adenosine modification protein YeaZ
MEPPDMGGRVYPGYTPAVRSLWLAIDATSPRSSAALAEAGRLLAQASTAAGETRGGRSLLELVDDCFRASGRDFSDVESVVAVNGPGSFTGVRVTLATAMGLVSASSPGSRLFAISSLAALALQAPPDAISVVARIDALRGEWFHQRFNRETAAGELRPAGEAERAALGETDPRSTTVLLRGAGAAPESDSVSFVEAAPLAAPIAIASSSGAAGALLVPRLAPLYLRAPAVTPARPSSG